MDPLFKDKTGELPHDPGAPPPSHPTPSAAANQGNAADDLTLSQTRYTALINHLRDGLAVYQAVEEGNDFVIVDFNPAAERMERVRKEDIVGRKVSEVFPGVAKFGLLEVFRRVWQSGRSEHFPVRRYEDERIRGWRDNLVYRLPSGEVVALYRDETNHKRQEEELKRTNQTLQAALRMGRLGYWHFDAARRQMQWSDQMFAMLGQDPALGVPNLSAHHQWVHPEDRDLVAETMQRALAEGESREMVVRLVMPDQRVRWFNTQCHPQHDETGAITGLNGILLDITEIKEVEIAKESLERQLHRAQKMEALGTITGGIAHDFNNILGIILGNAELTKDEVPPASPASRNLDEIVEATLRARGIIRQLLSFARDTQYKPAPTDLGGLVEQAMHFIRAAVPANVHIRQSIRSSHPLITVDAGQIHQVLLNLCTNAMHAMEPDGGVLEVAVHDVRIAEGNGDKPKGLPPGEYLCLSVRDTGHGIDPVCMERIFDPYFTTKDVGKGSGLGLAVVHGIVQKHGATIHVESKRGRGSLFSIYFPRRPSSAPATSQDAAEPAAMGQESILMVEDEKALASTSRDILQRLGYRVTLAENGEQALALVQDGATRFDLVISDMTMPGMGGDMLVDKLRKIRPGLPVLLCTGFSPKMDQDKAQKLGIHYAEKPLDRKTLICLVRQVLDGGAKAQA
jgi:PAS domain S-box-containing protein